jgi:hypothetical protein
MLKKLTLRYALGKQSTANRLGPHVRLLPNLIFAD